MTKQDTELRGSLANRSSTAPTLGQWLIPGEPTFHPTEVYEGPLTREQARSRAERLALFGLGSWPDNTSEEEWTR